MEDKYLWTSRESYKKLTKPDGEYLHWACSIDDELPIPISASGKGSKPPMTFPDLFDQAIRRFASEAALRVKKKDHWVTYTYSDYYQEVIRFAGALVTMGVSERRAINIIGFNSLEWFISYSGAIYANCIPVGVYTTNNSEACFYIADHSECELAIVQNIVQLKKYLQQWDSLPKLKAIVVYHPEESLESYKQSRNIYTWQEFMSMGASNQSEVESRKLNIRPSMAATIIYTSGTTGNPKGVLLTHDNITWTIMTAIDLMTFKHNKSHILSYLPLSHVAGQLGIVFSLYRNSLVSFADEKALYGSLGQFIKEVRPTSFFTVPRLYQKIEEKLKEAAKNRSRIQQAIGNWAKRQTLANIYADKAGKSTSLQYKLARSIVLNRLYQMLGFDRCDSFAVGAAPIAKSTLEYFLSLGMPLLNTYGLSETTGPASINVPSKFNIHASGFPLPGTSVIVIKDGRECTTNEEGEICMKGRNVFMGYFKNPEETKKSIDQNGYFHSGDLGYIGEDGFIRITGRIKELIVTSGGENIPPVLIEDKVKLNCPIVSYVMIVGENRNYITALITLKVETNNGVPTNTLEEDTVNELLKVGIEVRTVEEAIRNSSIKKYIQDAIDRTNQQAISRAQQIRKWKILSTDFSISGGELTPTMKLKRKVVEEKYARDIEELYAEPKL